MREATGGKVGKVRVPLVIEDREDISRGLAKGLSNKDIAHSIGRNESVVSREIDRHGGPGGLPCLEGRRGGTGIPGAPERAQDRRRTGAAGTDCRRSAERLVAGADIGQAVL